MARNDSPATVPDGFGYYAESRPGADGWLDNDDPNKQPPVQRFVRESRANNGRTTPAPKPKPTSGKAK